jgi:uncharacterized sporulation protein YeaH/YhbH (DUF444 family)
MNKTYTVWMVTPAGKMHVADVTRPTAREALDAALLLVPDITNNLGYDARITCGRKLISKHDAKVSQWGTPNEILSNVMSALERDVEWPLTELLPLAEVNTLLAPIRQRVNDEIKKRQNNP